MSPVSCSSCCTLSLGGIFSTEDQGRSSAFSKPRFLFHPLLCSPTLSWPLYLIVPSYFESADQAATIRPQVSSRTGSEPAKLTARNRRLWEHQGRSKHLAQMASHSQDTVSTEAPAPAPVPAEKPYRKTELQVKMGTEAPVLIF